MLLTLWLIKETGTTHHLLVKCNHCCCDLLTVTEVTPVDNKSHQTPFTKWSILRRGGETVKTTNFVKAFTTYITIKAFLFIQQMLFMKIFIIQLRSEIQSLESYLIPGVNQQHLSLSVLTLVMVSYSRDVHKDRIITGTLRLITNASNLLTLISNPNKKQ